jgi:heterokaryon incompatibility protein (HET)
MRHKGRIDWLGKPVCDVGTRYRTVSPSTACTLCRQLHAPWIEPFLKSRDPNDWRVNDLGDRIHIFPHLRHLPHVNDFPASRKVLRRENAPYHIAVVPVGRGWRDELREHLTTKGMVVVMPEGVPESELFAPQKVSRKFEPSAILPWLKLCKRHHKNLCNIKAPKVPGMKVIDCNSKDLRVRNYLPDDRYAALSYVWGKPASSETPTLTQAEKATLQKENTMKTGPKNLQFMAKTLPHAPTPKLDPMQKISMMKQVPGKAVKKTYCATTVSRKKSDSRLPKDIPLTIKDAIQVTKALGYRWLWVDKYCIDQNNETEKQTQCGRMGDIYAGSQITIFALGHDSNYGLPGVSYKSRFWQQQCTTIGQYKFVSTKPDPQFSIQQSTWSTRGWTYQEGLFSTRCLFFTNYQVYFECNAMNCLENFKSNLKLLHVNSGRRFRAYHRAGKFVCGNSNQYSHINVRRNKANHRKIDTIRRYQYQIREYSNRELTNKDDILYAFAGIARFYAKTTAKIVSLAGIPIPFPIANLSDTGEERLNHLSYALAWTHRVSNLNGLNRKNPNNRLELARKHLPWTPYDNPKPHRRKGFPSWSWAGWFGEIGKRNDLPYCWTSYLSSVRISFRGGGSEDYLWLQKFTEYKHYLIQKLLIANALHFDAYVLNPEKLKFWKKDPYIPCTRIPSPDIQVYLSIGSYSLDEIHQKLMDKKFECLVIGTYGKPREDIFKAIRVADKKRRKARHRRIELFERREPDAIICLVVQTVNEISYRVGLLKVKFEDIGMEHTLQAWGLDEKRRFTLG